MLTWLLFTSIVLLQDGGFVPVASVAEIMQALVVPSSNLLFNVGLEPPADDEGWKGVENNAIVLAESGNLLMLPERAEGREGWIEAARQMAEAGRASLEAARARDTDELIVLGDRILETCSTCHDEYWIVN